MASKYTNWSQNIPNCYKIYQTVIKYTKYLNMMVIKYTKYLNMMVIKYTKWLYMMILKYTKWS
jgi:hypothetical protein